MLAHSECIAIGLGGCQVQARDRCVFSVGVWVGAGFVYSLPLAAYTDLYSCPGNGTMHRLCLGVPLDSIS